MNGIMSCSEHVSLGKTPTFLNIIVLSFLSLFLFFIAKRFSFDVSTNPSQTFPITNKTTSAAVVVARPLLERTGIIDENGAMTNDFEVGDFDVEFIDTLVNATHHRDENRGALRVKIGKFRVCDESMKQFNCLVPSPKHYKLTIPWPKSRDQIWFSNVAGAKGESVNNKWVKKKGDKYIFPGDHGAVQYLDRISKMVPEISFGQRTRVAMDIGGGVANFGAYLMDRNVSTLTISSKEVHRNQIQFALERGVPAMLAAFSTHRLLYPSLAFDLIHCSTCSINWTRDDGVLLLEVNRILRPGGYFIWAVEENMSSTSKEMEDLTSRFCWNLRRKEGDISIWRKPLNNNSCYVSHGPAVEPSMCDASDDPDNVWNVNLKTCLTKLPENGYGANVSAWPARLHSPPDRLFSIKMDAELSRREIYKAETKFWKEMISGYIGAFHWKELNLRNVMDMRAVYGGFAASLHDFNLDCWVMNVVPVSGSNTLPVLYDRGLIGVMHDWCEPFDTYPRTYDLLHAAALFSVERKRCNVTTIMLEMDRILRPGGRVYIRDTTPVIEELEEIAGAVGWVPFKCDSSEGPNSNWKLLIAEKRL